MDGHVHGVLVAPRLLIEAITVMRDARPTNDKRGVGAISQFLRLTTDCRAGWDVSAHIQAAGSGADGRRTGFETKICIGIDEKRIGLDITFTEIVPLRWKN